MYLVTLMQLEDTWKTLWTSKTWPCSSFNINLKMRRLFIGYYYALLYNQ